MPAPRRFFVLDGTALAFRSHYAMARSGLTALDGSATGATYGFTMVLRRLLEVERPDLVAVAFDHVAPTFRHKRYADYKATRQKAPEELIAQLENLREVVRAHGMPIFEVPGYEADDVIGTLSRQAEEAGDEVFIVTGDKDMLQLVSDQVRLYNVFRPDREGPEIQGYETVRAKFGTDPAHVVEVLAIMGDASDNVPGVKGIGEKGAIKLITEYGSVEGVLAHLDELSPKLRALIERNREMLLLSHELVIIDRHVPLDPGYEAIRPPAPDPVLLEQVFTRLDFQSLLRKLRGTQGAGPGNSTGDAGSAPVSASPTAAPRPTRTDRIVRDAADLEALLGELRTAGRFALDTETTSLAPLEAQLVGASFSSCAGSAWYLPFNAEPPVLPGGTQALIEALRPVLTSSAVRLCGQNCKYDWLVFGAHGLELPAPDFDTMVASFVVAGSARRHNLDALALYYFGEQKIPTSELIGTGKAQITMAEVPLERVAEYACEDAEVTWRLVGVLESELREKQSEAVFREQELPLVPVLIRMEAVGIRIDTAQLAVASKELEVELERATHKVQEYAGRNFNLNSNKVLGEVLFEELRIQDQAGVKKPKRTQTGWSTDAETLETHYAEIPIVRQLLEYREIHKLKSTYVDALPRFVNPRTGRVHGSFSQVSAATGRLASSDPNLQNIPIRSERGRKLRAAFVPREPDERGAWLMLSADYSQIELRIMAHLSGDEAMRRAFEQDRDIHAQTAAVIFDVDPVFVTREMRSQAKVINFGLLYGMGPARLARETGMGVPEAKRFIERYFASFPRVRGWIENTLVRARETGYVETLLGHRRPMPDLKSDNQRVRAMAENAAVNTPVQGSAADVIKRAMIAMRGELQGAGLSAELLLQVHDELVFELPEAELEPTRELVRRVMEGAVTLKVPLKVECGSGKNWLEAH